jgi:hypothetical protein
MPTILALGKLGDVINLLPLARFDNERGNRWKLIVSHDYASLLDGVSYLDPIVFNGNFMELSRAVDFAKTIDEGYKIAQVCGDRETVLREAYVKSGIDINAQYCESFAKEQWRLLGRLAEWKNQYPLVFDNRQPVRESELLKKMPSGKKGWILCNLGGVTSPFPWGNVLMEMLRLRFGRWYEIVDISKIRADRFYDLLGIYEHPNTKCLVSCDTATLQLAYACPALPVVALTQDQPSLWHGSPNRPQYIAHVRYGDFPNRAVEILGAIGNIGKAGSFFAKGISSPKVVHVWSQYEITEANKERHQRAKKEWQKSYDLGAWVSSPMEIGSFGRDTKVKWPDEIYRYPFLKDAVRLATLKADAKDVIMLTRPDIFPTGSELEQRPMPAYSHRYINGEKRSQIDAFMFTREWWDNNVELIPDFVMGSEQNWCQGLAAFMGKDAEWGVCKREDSAPVEYKPSPYRKYNEELLVEFAKKIGLSTAKPSVVDQVDCSIINAKAVYAYGYNPSIIRHDGRLLMMYRSHRTGNLTTQLAIAELDEQFNVLNNQWLEGDLMYSTEDGRLFHHGNDLYCSYTESRLPNEYVCVVKYGQLTNIRGRWTLINVKQPKYGGNDFTSSEKNWCFFSV